jgi:ParB-like chromosome segregation protein Spo0J
MIERIPISSIQIPKNHRNPKRVETLANSIKHVGQLEPIIVRDDMKLIAGGRRLAAIKLLGDDLIDANVLTVSDIDAELIEIDENLERHELTVLQRSEQLARRKELYEARHPETKAGVAGGKARQGKGKSATKMISFAEDTAAKSGVSPETVRQEVQIAEDLDSDVKEAIKGTDLEDRKVDLLELSRLPKEEQGPVVEEIAKAKAKGKKTTVAKAAKGLGVKARRGKAAPTDDEWLAGMPMSAKLEGPPLKTFQ